MTINEALIPENDIDFLQGKEYEYELIPFNAGVYLIIMNYDFPEAYTPRVADLLIRLPTGYPNSRVDMFFTKPDVKLINGTWPQASANHVPQNATNWQQWSRHINWRIGVDSLRTFFAAIKKELAKGV